MRGLAITGVGIVSAAGIGYDRFVDALSTPDKTLFTANPSAFAHADETALSVAEVRDFDHRPFIGEKGLRNNDRLTKLMLVASRIGLADSGLRVDGEPGVFDGDDLGVCASTAYGSLETIVEIDRVAHLEDPRYLNPGKFPNTVTNSAAGFVSIWDSLRALNVTVTNGPTGGLDVFDCAAVYLSSRRAKALLVGGAEALSEGLWQGFRRLGVLADGADQVGTRLGEAAVFCVTEPIESARRRGASVRAKVTGYGSAFEPAQIDGPLVAPSSAALSRAIEMALADAGITASRVSLVASGLSGIADFDTLEREAIVKTLGDTVAVATPKSRFGETLGAAGALSTAAAVAWLGGARVNDVALGERPGEVSTVLVTALGFYGNASALIVQREE